jgi:transposase-like protein
VVQKTPLKSETGRHNCKNCKRNFSVLVGAIFQDSRLLLSKGFQIITLMINAKMGVSAKKIMREVGVSYKTAWYACMHIRFSTIDDSDELQNIVEMDEANTGEQPRKKYPDNDPS